MSKLARIPLPIVYRKAEKHTMMVSRASQPHTQVRINIGITARQTSDQQLIILYFLSPRYNNNYQPQCFPAGSSSSSGSSGGGGTCREITEH